MRQNRRASKGDDGMGYQGAARGCTATVVRTCGFPRRPCAWMLDPDAHSYEDIAHAFVDGDPVGSLTRGEGLDNITLTW
jgi:hypothetical protein